ncbi:MAG: hypothetical protein EBS19_13980, partial [Spirochaetia bacterium]|nr:hypothetical protein [Spirochaetia bacterium]
RAAKTSRVQKNQEYSQELAPAAGEVPVSPGATETEEEAEALPLVRKKLEVAPVAVSTSGASKTSSSKERRTRKSRQPEPVAPAVSAPPKRPAARPSARRKD